MKVAGWVFIVLGAIDTIIALILRGSGEASLLNGISRLANDGGPGIFDILLYGGIAFLVIGVIFLVIGYSKKQSLGYVQAPVTYSPMQNNYTGQATIVNQASAVNGTIAVNKAPVTNQAVSYCKCGTPLVSGERFCRSCGTNLLADSHSCIKCGSKLNPGQKFCISCGAQQS